jgi:type I restriction enzyme S subunit
MSKYEKYKSSNIESIGVVPDHWNVVRLKKVIKEKITDGPHETPDFIDDGIPFLSVDGIQDGELIFEGCRYISPEAHREYQKKCVVEKDDVLMGKAASTGKIARVKVDFEFNIWSPLALIKPNRNRITPTFLEYSLKSDFGQIQIDLLCTSNTQKNISMDDIPKLSICQPPLDEQLNIANYLDHQTQKIDRLIANKNAQAEKLKELRQIEINNAVTQGLNPNAEMKDSGIDWLGEIPKHWAVKRLKNVSNFIQTGITPPSEKSEYYDGDIPWYGPGGFNGDTILSNPAKYITQKAIEDNEAKLFPIDCIFMIGIGATIGKVGIIKEPSSCNQQLNIVNFKSYVSPDFGVYFLKTYENIIIKIANFSTLPIYNQVQTGNLKFLLPPKEEQLQIAKYLQERTAAIDKLIINIDAQIEKLQELRKIKIYEAVTGKIKVNTYVEATA